MGSHLANPVVHLELRTANPARACAFYSALFDWRVEPVRVGSQSYLTLELGTGIQGGVVELENRAAAWLPYAEVDDIHDATDWGRRLGGEVTLEPCEGPAGWQSILAVPAGAEIALWQPKL